MRIMKRTIVNKKSVIFLFCVAIFTLLSFVFDQLVINQEKKIRIKNQQYFENYEKSSNLISKEFVFFLTSARLSTMVDETNVRFEIFFNLVNISKSSEYLNNIRSTNKNYYHDYYNNVFKDYISELDYRFAQILLSSRLQLTTADQKDYNAKFKKDYDHIEGLIVSMKSGFAKFIKNSNQAGYLILLKERLDEIYERMRLLAFKINQESEYISNEQTKLDASLEIIQTEIAEQSGQKNLFILFSVTTQICSLLFLALLFRELIKDLKIISSTENKSLNN